jgi:murein DD-endopeptidase MepM/ murein hydrolase activator NlpD
LSEKEAEIRGVLGEPFLRRTRYSRLPDNSQSFYRFPARGQQAKWYADNDLNVQLAGLDKSMESLKEGIDGYYQKAQLYKARFASTPSIWPLYGRISSGYGYRFHPILGRFRFHQGVDIPAWIGAPVKATADGVVIYAGWQGTFGNMVQIRHGLGYMTRYGHCSKVLVQTGDVIKKGQVIAQVGSTGLSTGPHLHYEVIRWKESIPPGRYLDLDMFTASTKVW